MTTQHPAEDKRSAQSKEGLTELERKIMQLRSGGGAPLDAETVADTFAVGLKEAQIALESLEYRGLIQSLPVEYKFVGSIDA